MFIKAVRRYFETISTFSLSLYSPIIARIKIKTDNIVETNNFILSIFKFELGCIPAILSILRLN